MARASGSTVNHDNGRATTWGRQQAVMALAMSTIAFTISFACWMLYGVLVTWLVDQRVFPWTRTQMGWLIGTPVLTGAVMRLPMGVLSDRYGGRPVFALVMLAAAIPLFLVGQANSYLEFLLAGLGFGLAGSTFAVGVAYSSVWFRREQQGLALGIFGMGTAGTAITSMGAPFLLGAITDQGGYLEGWRTLPKIYAVALVATAGLFWLLTCSRKAERPQELTLLQRLEPLNDVRVWRFGLYYYFLFGGFVALAQWLIPYYVNAYSMSVATAGAMAAAFSLPAGVFRALGGWLSDRFGARTVLYGVLGPSVILMIMLSVPRMAIQSPGQGVLAERGGIVTAVSDREIEVGERTYPLSSKGAATTSPVSIEVGIHREDNGNFLIFPIAEFSQMPAVKAGDRVVKGQLLARGVTHIYFQANVKIFAGLVLLVGMLMGIGSAAVYKHIPGYFPESVGVVGGIVGVLGGLGGFFNPIIFGYLLQATGIWTTCWTFLGLVVATCLVWMHIVIQRMPRPPVPVVQVDEVPAGLESR